MTSINLFPTEEKQTLRAEKLKFQFSFSAYSSYMTISDRDKELTIYLDDKVSSNKTQCQNILNQIFSHSY